MGGVLLKGIIAVWRIERSDLLLGRSFTLLLALGWFGDYAIPRHYLPR